MKLIETAPHEFAANLLFTEWGLAPWFAFNSSIKRGNGKQTAEFSLDGERWICQLTYRNDSNIVHPGDRTPTHTEWKLQPDTTTDPNTIKKEYAVKIARHPDEDEHGQQDFSAHITPRWSGMMGLSSDGSLSPISIPDEITEAINVRVQGSNIEFDRYHQLLVQGFRSIDINPGYVGTAHRLSNIQDAERYVRVHSGECGPIHSRSGPLASLGHLLETDREGYRKVVQNDQNERGQTVEGYYHVATLGPTRIQEAWPSHGLPKEIKHYYSRESVNLPDSHPLAHPKLGASYQVNRQPHDETLYFDQIEQLNHELEETVRSVLDDAGLDLNPITGTGPYVDCDPYFDAHFVDGESPTRLSLTQIESEQENVVIRHLAGGLTNTQWDYLQALVTDGGRLSPQDIANESDRHVESVRRSLREMDDLVETGYSEVALRSDYVADIVYQALRDAQREVKKAIETVGQAVSDDERRIDEHISAWQAWGRRHGIDHHDEPGEQMEFEMGEVTNKTQLVKLLRQGEKLWDQMDQSVEEFRNSSVSWQQQSQGRRRSYRKTVWRLLSNSQTKSSSLSW